MGSGGQGLGPLVYAGIQPLVRLTWFTLRLGSYVGWKWPVALAVYFFASLGAETPFERAISLRTIMNIWFDDLSRQAQDSHFLSFPYVCPEHVLVKSSFLYINCSKRPDSNDDLSRQAPDKRKSRVKRKVVSAGITRMLWRDLQWLSKEASRLDSLFKRIHARVRIHAESIAFYGGGGAEREFAERQFDQVLNAFFAPTLYAKNDRSTKTGSGQA